MDYIQRTIQSYIKAIEILAAKNIAFETISLCERSDNENTIYVDDKEFAVYDDRVDKITMVYLEFFQDQD